MHAPSMFFFQAEDGIRDLVRSRGLGDVYKRQFVGAIDPGVWGQGTELAERAGELGRTAFEEPAAAGRKKRIAAEHEARLDVPVSYTHLTLPTSDLVKNSVVAVSLKKNTETSQLCGDSTKDHKPN